MFRPSQSTARRTLSLCTARKGNFSTSSSKNSYDDTFVNLKIGAHTRVMFQGFTGRQATANAKESIAYGTNVVGGVTPGKSGEHLGLPVLSTVREAMEQLKPDATGIYVAAHQAPAAIIEAIEAEVPLIVVVAEHLPIHDVMRILSMLKTQSKSRLLGGNCPGIISAIGKCRIGFQPLPCFKPGLVGIVAKSGTLSYEAVASTTRSGLGQSLCIGIGGDVLAGTNFVDALKIFEHDDATQGIVLIGEIGGAAELDAVEWIKDYSRRTANPKPIVSIIGGVQAPPGRVMGHAGAFTVRGEPNARQKIRALEDVGVTVVNHPAKFGEAIKRLLGGSGRASSMAAVGQRRGIYTKARKMRPLSIRDAISKTQKRNVYIRQDQAFDLLRERGIDTTAPSTKDTQCLLSIAIDRSTLSPCIIASPAMETACAAGEKRFPFDYRNRLSPADIPQISSYLQLSPSTATFLPNLVNSLIKLFMQKEASLLETHFVERLGELKITGANFAFDDAAFRSAKRQADIHALRRIQDEDADEVDAESHGIAYIKLAGAGNIGTLVNGAGLAMNTVDALADAGGVATNFLDTGGKATSETVKQSFQIILRDKRVKAIFVNIFGGLTLGDMIANGVLLAFKELDMKIPVVVRIRGTNEAEGQKIIAESGLPLHAFDDFEQAAAKVIELANRG